MILLVHRTGVQGRDGGLHFQVLAGETGEWSNASWKSDPNQMMILLPKVVVASRQHWQSLLALERDSRCHRRDGTLHYAGPLNKDLQSSDAQQSSVVSEAMQFVQDGSLEKLVDNGNNAVGAVVCFRLTTYT